MGTTRKNKIMLILKSASRPSWVAMALLCVFVLASCASGPDTSARTRFETSGAAFEAMVSAIKAEDRAAADTMLGPHANEVLGSGDPVADKAARLRFVRLYDEAHQVEPAAAGDVLFVGKQEWPMPIPVIRDDRGWYFDTEEGIEEMIDRRVGRNELATIQTCLAYVDAQRDYVSADRNGDGIMEYAQKIRSTPGKQDGLYWKSGPGKPQSPLGDLAADAAQEGYDPDRASRDPRPYHGYYFRILTSQGDGAEGGAYDYMAGDAMMGGCALIAYPARYGISGVMSFMVNHAGVVFQRDLGNATAKRAQAVTAFDPAGWDAAEQ